MATPPNPEPQRQSAPWDRSQLVAIATGIFSVLLAIAYLLLVQLLDFRGNMEPAPLEDLGQQITGSPPISLALATPPQLATDGAPGLPSAPTLSPSQG